MNAFIRLYTFIDTLLLAYTYTLSFIIIILYLFYCFIVLFCSITLFESLLFLLPFTRPNLVVTLSYKILNVQQISNASLCMIHILKVVYHHMTWPLDDVDVSNLGTQ